MATMEITYLGHSSFRIKAKTGTVVTDPYDDSVGFKFPQVEADIVTISHDHLDHNQSKKVEGHPFVIEAAGEYEIKEIFVIGVDTYHDSSSGTQRGRNTCFVFEMEGLRIGHLGDLGHPLKEESLEEIGNLDILMVPVGGVFTIDPRQAEEVIGQIEPSIVIPMHFRTDSHDTKLYGQLSTLEAFTKQVGGNFQTLPKLIVSKEKLPEEQEIVILEPKHG